MQYRSQQRHETKARASRAAAYFKIFPPDIHGSPHHDSVSLVQGRWLGFLHIPTGDRTRGPGDRAYLGFLGALKAGVLRRKSCSDYQSPSWPARPRTSRASRRLCFSVALAGSCFLSLLALHPCNPHFSDLSQLQDPLPPPF